MKNKVIFHYLCSCLFVCLCFGLQTGLQQTHVHANREIARRKLPGRALVMQGETATAITAIIQFPGDALLK